MTDKIDTFSTGASRNTASGKLDYSRFLSSRVQKIFCEYMEKNRFLEDGSVRDPDNWKKGIPIDRYLSSLSRHYWDVWNALEEGERDPIEALCAVIFNAQGLIYELTRPISLEAPTIAQVQEADENILKRKIAEFEAAAQIQNQEQYRNIANQNQLTPPTQNPETFSTRSLLDKILKRA